MSEFMTPKMTFGEQLRFTPYAWAKLLWMRDRGDTEVAGYGVTATEDPLLVTDFVLIKQECTGASFDLDPEDGADYMDRMLDTGLPPWAYSNILIHTHPGNSPTPSGTDEKNFVAAFSHPNWAIMFIIAEGGAAYCRLKVNVGPGVIKEIKVAVDWTVPFGGTDTQAWETEYKAKVVEQKFRMTGKEGAASSGAGSFPANGYEDPLWWCEEHDRWTTQQEELDRQIAAAGDGSSTVDDIDCHWDSNGDVAYWDDEDGVWFFYDPIREQWYVEDLEGDDEFIETTPPNEHWVTQVVLWANRYADERELAMEEAV